MVQVRPLLFILGLLICVLAAAMLLPALVDIADDNPDWKVFLGSSVITFFMGGLLLLVNYDDRQIELGLKDGFALTTASWIAVPAFAAVPFVGLGLDYTDSFFEAMSGITTTGATVLQGLDRLPRGILLWRALLNWVGGIGIVLMAIVILPFLRVGGMQLFHTQNRDRPEKVMPRAFGLVAATAGAYFVLSLTCAGLYAIYGMSLFDAICHAMSTLATGGFSTHDENFGFFKSPAIEWIAISFMILGALPFVAFVRLLGGDAGALWRDPQVRAIVLFLVIVSLLMATWLGYGRAITFMEALRTTAFHVTSIVTTAGFATEDYQKWGPLAVGVFFVLTFIGGCAGSTAGGIKVYRLQIAAVITRSHVMHLISPNRVVPLSYNGRRLPAEVPFSVVAFLAIYMGTVGIIAVALSAMGLDMVTAVSAAAAALGNVGPGLGEIIGPKGSYLILPATAKWLLAFAMMLGRLELFTVLVLLRPEFWRS